MHAIVLVATSSSVQGSLYKLLGRCKSVKLFLLEVVVTVKVQYQIDEAKTRNLEGRVFLNHDLKFFILV